MSCYWVSSTVAMIVLRTYVLCLSDWRSSGRPRDTSTAWNICWNIAVMWDCATTPPDSFTCLTLSMKFFLTTVPQRTFVTPHFTTRLSLLNIRQGSILNLVDKNLRLILGTSTGWHQKNCSLAPMSVGVTVTLIHARYSKGPLLRRPAIPIVQSLTLALTITLYPNSTNPY